MSRGVPYAGARPEGGRGGPWPPWGFRGYPPEQPSGCRGCQGVSPARGLDPKGVEEARGLHGASGGIPLSSLRAAGDVKGCPLRGGSTRRGRGGPWPPCYSALERLSVFSQDGQVALVSKRSAAMLACDFLQNAQFNKLHD